MMPWFAVSLPWNSLLIPALGGSFWFAPKVAVLPIFDSIRTVPPGSRAGLPVLFLNIQIMLLEFNGFVDAGMPSITNSQQFSMGPGGHVFALFWKFSMGKMG